MNGDVPSTIQKALEINLDPLKYGTIVEIGAGQEVARWFFQAGAAAGTVAKTMSAYDMNFSDEIYGTATDRRYVSRLRLERMLDHEFDLLTTRLEEHRSEDTNFFAFADTVTARGFKQQDECHGWLGIRLQLTPKSAPDDVILHVRMLDDTNLEQQEALGILGINLIYGAFFHSETPEILLRSLMDNLKWGRVEIDLVRFNGPVLGGIDDRLMALELVKASLVPAVMFEPGGRIVIPAEALYKKSVLGIRGEFRPPLSAAMAMFERAKTQFFRDADVEEDKTVFLAEMTMAELANDGDIDTADFLTRVDELSNRGFYVLISEFFRYFRVRQYIYRHTQEPVAFVTDASGFGDIMRQDYYGGLSGGMLEGLGQLFPPGTTVYVCPNREEGLSVGLDDYPVAPHLQPLVAYLRGLNLIVALND
jgi:hypothetical protein